MQFHPTPRAPQASPTGPQGGRLARRVAIVAMGVAIATASACSAPSEDTASANTDALAALDEDTRAHVEFEASWQCDLTRFAFEDLSEIDAMRVDQLESFGITDDAHDDFIERLDTEPELAELVADLSADCTGTGTDIDGDSDGPVEL